MSQLYQQKSVVEYDFDEIESIANKDGNPCYLIALDERQILVLFAALKSAEFGRTRWAGGTMDVIDALVAETELCLMSGCRVGDLVSVQRMMVAALTGESVDLSTELPASVDYSVLGIGPRLDALTAKIEEVRALVAAGNTEVDDVEEILDAINIVLGGMGVL